MTTPEPPPLDTNWQRNPGHVLAAGDRAPDFEGIAHTGMRVKLSGFSNKPTIVYFAPRDASSEGTAEARGFRDDWMRMNEKVSTVLGVTADDRATHYDFATAEKLPFLLVADEQGHIARSFGCVSDQGSTTNVAFLIGADGKIVRVFSEASPNGHVAAVVSALESN
jgi:thioredoxin-dependent peroxiredoxin